MQRKRGRHAAGGDRVAHLRVDNDLDRLGLHGTLIHVHRTKPIRMSHDGDPRPILDALDQAIAPAGDDQVDVSVLVEQAGDLVPGRDRLDVRPWQLRPAQRLLDHFAHDALGEEGLLAALEDGRVPALDRERRDVHNHLGSGLKDDEDHPDRARHPVQGQFGIELFRVGHLAGRVRERGDVEDALEHVVVLRGGREQIEPLEKRRRHLAERHLLARDLHKEPQTSARAWMDGTV